MRTFRYISLSIFIFGIIFLLCPTYNIYALDTSYNNDIIASVSGEGTEQDYKDLYAQAMLAQAIIDGGKVDFREVNSPISWVDFVDSITTPILQAVDDASPINFNFAGMNSRINECLVDYYNNGIVRNMNSSLTVPNSVGNVWSAIMRSRDQKNYIGGGGTSIGETLLQLAQDVYNMSQAEEQETYLPQDYLWFQNINKLYYNDVDFFHFNTFRSWRYSNVWYSLNSPLESYSYYLINIENSDSFGHLPRTGVTPTYISLTSYLPKLSIYYNTSTNTATYSSSNNSSFLSGGDINYRLIPPFNDGEIDTNGFVLVQDISSEIDLRTTFESFDNALNWFYQHWFNIDFYVDGQLWVTSATPSNSFTFGGTTVDSGNNPMELSIPDFYSFDFGRFKDIILDAINHSSVVMYEDIADCFLDINGQTCIATYSVVRNDYDDLVSEQFNMVSYPRFDSDLYTKTLVNQFRDDTQAGVQIIKESYNIFPQPLIEALLYCGLLVLFGLLIRRFLE